MIDLKETDKILLSQKGITEEKVKRQVETFKEGIPFVTLKKAAIVNDGILKIAEHEEKELVAFFESTSQKTKLLKFVPASGAASRMFKAMFNFIEVYDPQKEALTDYIQRTGDTAIELFFHKMDKFPFYKDILQRIAGKHSSDGELAHAFVQEMLSEEGLNFGFYPKGLLPFHECKRGSATPFKEHLKEAALYSKTNGKAHLHFTISPQHESMFKEEEQLSVPRISQKTDTEFHVSYSFQKTSTDTIAVTNDNNLFRNSDGSLLFRPGGHGALIENLNEQDADVIFIKNIDNVVVDKNLEAVAGSKKMLAGLLLKVQQSAFEFARALEDNEASEETLHHIAQFLEEHLNVKLPSNYKALSIQEQQSVLKDRLNRPIRICGMVKNEGEPGGGPFWIEDSNGNVSLQIIESAQINMDDKEQAAILQNSTHFNPVDIICGIKNHNGDKYDLLKFVDEKQGFITGKTKEGKELKALELPGLWNGAMAFWNTIFVEVPLVTFNPVKTVNDLLKPSHQP